MSLMNEFRIGITTREVGFGQDCKALIPTESIDPYFLAYAIRAQTQNILGLVDAAGHGTGRLQTDRIESLRIPLPRDIQFQKATVAPVKALDEKIAVNTRIASSTDALLRAHFSAAMQQASHSVKLRQIVDLRYGKALKEEHRTPGPIPVYGGNGVSGWHNTSLVSGPGVIVGRKGANAGSVSWSHGPFWPIDTAFYAEPTSALISCEFLLLLLNNIGLRGLVGDSAIPGLNREIVLGCDVLVPIGEMIDRFTSTARLLLSFRDHTSNESRSLAGLRDALLPRLMSGEIRIRDAEKIVEDTT